MKKFLHIILFTFLAGTSWANTPDRFGGVKYYLENNLDSAFICLSYEKSFADNTDEDLADIYSLYGEAYSLLNMQDSATYYYFKSNEILGDSYPDKRIENLQSIANIYYHQGFLKRADSLFQVCLQEVQYSNNNRLKADILLDAGWLSREQGRHAEALDYYFKAKRIAEFLEDKALMADACTKIAVVYHVKYEFEIAKSYYDQSLALLQELEDYKAIARLYNNYGLLYDYQGDYYKAIPYFERSEKMSDSLGNERGVAIANENLGLVCYTNLKNYPLALLKFNKSIAIWRKQNDIYGQAQTLVYMMYVFNAQGNYKATLDTGYLSLNLAKQAGARDVERDAYKEIYLAYEGMGKSALALLNYKNFISLRDSLDAENSLEEIRVLGIEQETETKRIKDSLNLVMQHEQDSASIKLQVEEQKFWTYILLFGLFLIGVIAVLLMRSAKQRKRTNAEIKKAHLLLQEKNNEVIDSINYAKRIQEAILPSKDLIDSTFKNNFVFYKPKDIVAGDFYWLDHYTNEKEEKVNLFAVADCTGHGVPGAMVSVICSGALNKTVNEQAITEPAAILENVAKLVVRTFDMGKSEINDGMDIALISHNTTTNEVIFSGANNDLWLVSKEGEKSGANKTILGPSGTVYLHEFKSAKRPVGRYSIDRPFTSTKVTVNPGETLYLYTDGYADQFGGDKNKKFKYKTLKNLLLDITHEGMDNQRKKLDENLAKWMGGLDQVDDICIVGIKF